MNFVVQFREWKSELCDHKNQLDNIVSTNLRKPGRSSELIRLVLDRLHITGLTSRGVVDILRDFHSKATQEQDQEAYFVFQSAFDVYWNRFSQDAYEYFEMESRHDGKTIKQFQEQYKKKLTFANLFTTRPWMMYCNSSSNLRRCQMLLDLSRKIHLPQLNKPTVTSSSPGTILPTISSLSVDDHLLMELPRDFLEHDLEAMATLMTTNCSLATVDEVKVKEMQHLERIVLAKCLHTEARIQKELNSLDVIPPYTDEPHLHCSNAFSDGLDEFVRSIKKFVETKSYSDTITYLGRIQEEEVVDADEQEQNEEEMEKGMKELQRLFNRYYVEKIGYKITKDVKEYYNGNLMDLASLRTDTCTFGAEATVFRSKLHSLEEAHKMEKEAASQVEGKRDTEIKIDDHGYTALLLEMKDRMDGMDLRMIRILICKELEAVIARYRPGIVSLMMKGSESAERWRTQAKQVLTLHTIKYDRPAHEELQLKLNQFQKRLYTEKIVPNLEVLGKCMKRHLLDFRSLRLEIESRINSIQKGLKAFHQFTTTTYEESVYIPVTWWNKLFHADKTTTNKQTIRAFKQQVYDKHIQSLS